MGYSVTGFAWLIFLVLIALFEWWAVHTKTPTLSAWVWYIDAKFGWFQWIVLAGIAGLMYHFFWQK